MAAEQSRNTPDGADLCVSCIHFTPLGGKQAVTATATALIAAVSASQLPEKLPSVPRLYISLLDSLHYQLD
jgi:hypothetical protein